MKQDKKLKDNMDNYLFEDNIFRYFLKEMLVKKSSLNDLTIKEIDSLVRDINTLLSNLRSDFKNSKKMLEVSDKDNWEGGTLFRNIILHNVLDINPEYEGTTKDFKNKLLERWNK